MWKNDAQPRPQPTIWRMRIGRYLSLKTHSIRNTCFPIQQWLYERASAVRVSTLAAFVSPDFTLKSRQLLTTGLTYAASLKRAALRVQTVAK
jgi:hypothetical protein